MHRRLFMTVLLGGGLAVATNRSAAGELPADIAKTLDETPADFMQGPPQPRQAGSPPALGSQGPTRRVHSWRARRRRPLPPPPRHRRSPTTPN